MLRFSNANSKIEKLYKVPCVKNQLNGRKIYSFDMLSGSSCPGARECKSQVIIQDGKRRIKDGPHTKFRCFSASQEVVYPGVYNLRKGNSDAVKLLVRAPGLLLQAFEETLPKDAGTVRVHVAGDHVNYNYFKMWCNLAKKNPSIVFYCYTKSLPFWLKARDAQIIPDNFRITASRGGLYDHLIDIEGLREARVVFSKKEANRLKLELDDNDYHAWRKLDKSFSLLIHGVQPKNTAASAALQKIKQGEKV